jgi:hypothetical protein
MLGYVYSTMDYIVSAVHFVLLCGVATIGIFLWYNDAKQNNK